TIVQGKRALQGNTDWLNADPYTKWQLALRFLFGIATNFIDLTSLRASDVLARMPMATPVVILCAIAVTYACRKAGRSPRAFVLSSMLIPTVLLLVPDLICGGRRSTPWRYLIPMYVGIQMAVAYWISAISARRGRIGVGVLFLIGGIASCWIIANERAWWN